MGIQIRHCCRAVKAGNPALTGNLMDYPGSIPDNIYLLPISKVTFWGLIIPREAVREEPIRLASALVG